MIQIYLRSIHCHEETDEVGADEPYALVTAVNLAASVSVQGFPVPLPAFEVTRYGFDDVDDEEDHIAPGASRSFWGINGAPAPLNDPDEAIFVVGLMENDDGDPEALRGIVKGVVGGSVLGTLTAVRSDKVAALMRDVNSAMGPPTGAPNFDDRIGVGEVRFSAEELRRAEAGEAVTTAININGDGGRYELTFEARDPDVAPPPPPLKQPDILWQNSDDGGLQIWFMDGHRIRNRVGLRDENDQVILIKPPWRIAATGDFNLPVA